MGIGIVTAIGGLISLLVGIWKWVKRMKREERRIADEAKAQLDEGIKNNDPSAITAAFDRMRRTK